MTDKSTELSSPNRWWQLIAGVVCMVMIANLQYGWTLFVAPMSKAQGWAVSDIQFAFSIFIALETWLTPVEGWICDALGPKHGPKLVVAAGGILVAIGWILNSQAQTITALYIGAALTGAGGGAVYATCVGSAVKWFPDRRGLAVGLTAAGFGAGAALTVIPIRMVIAANGYQAAFFWFGLVQGAIVFALAWLLRQPSPGEVRGVTTLVNVIQSTQSLSPGKMLVSPIFWLLYVMFVLVSGSGLMATAQIALIAKDYNVADSVLFLGATTLTVTLVVDNVMNGLARPFFGWISDQIGREYTMAVAFGLGGIAYWLLGSAGTSPWTFMVCAGFIFLTWGEIFSLFPSTCTDTFGTKYATVNAAFLYTAKGTSAFLVPLANKIEILTGSWYQVLIITAIMNFVVVALALFVLKPLRARHIANSTMRLRAAE
ncbi:MAG TPA: oxalate/formate MFS antiporter [Stellaceae bacterium]|jgi:MFS transporter, OFA family, oxalate/formate antiporter|nr:oxalate/formate MFS antiporter [Stellaceae bacterium]